MSAGFRTLDGKEQQTENLVIIFNKERLVGNVLNGSYGLPRRRESDELWDTSPCTSLLNVQYKQTDIGEGSHKGSQHKASL